MLRWSNFLLESWKTQASTRALGASRSTCSLHEVRHVGLVQDGSFFPEEAEAQAKLAAAPGQQPDREQQQDSGLDHFVADEHFSGPATAIKRSEERRVGKECRSRWAATH